MAAHPSNLRSKCSTCKRRSVTMTHSPYFAGLCSQTKPFRLSLGAGKASRQCTMRAIARTKEPPAGLKIMEWTGDDDQVAALEMLRSQMSETECEKEVTEEQLQWFLMDRKLNVEAAKEKLCNMLKWRKEFGCVECIRVVQGDARVSRIHVCCGGDSAVPHRSLARCKKMYPSIHPFICTNLTPVILLQC